MAFDEPNLRWFAIPQPGEKSTDPLDRSAPFNIADIGHTNLTLQRQSTRGPKSYLMRVETHIQGSSIFLFISRETEPWPLRLKNDTNLTFTFQQVVSLHYQVCSRTNGLQGRRRERRGMPCKGSFAAVHSGLRLGLSNGFAEADPIMRRWRPAAKDIRHDGHWCSAANQAGCTSIVSGFRSELTALAATNWQAIHNSLPRHPSRW